MAGPESQTRTEGSSTWSEKVLPVRVFRIASPSFKMLGRLFLPLVFQPTEFANEKNKNETRQLHHIFLTSTAAGRHSESILSISEKISKAFRSRKAADFCLFIWWQDCAEKTLTSNNSCSSRSRNFFERSSCFRIFSSLECSQLLPKT